MLQPVPTCVTHMGQHIMKWTNLIFFMTLMSLDIWVIMACDKIQLGPFHYVATHILPNMTCFYFILHVALWIAPSHSNLK